MKAEMVYETPYASTASVAGAIMQGIAGQPVGFFAVDRCGPSRHGELEQGSGWGAKLGRSMR